MALTEKRFNMSFTLEEIISVETVEQVIRRIEAKLTEDQVAGQRCSPFG